MGALADLFRRHGPAYRQRFAERMPYDQIRAMRMIERCRTPALGGQHWQCPRCGQEHWAFHSCGNRHCPACGHADAREWLRRQQALAVPGGYYLCTFTVPEELRAAIRAHPRELLPLLFAASSSTLLDLCANPKWFGARPGMTGVLHTWTRALMYHPHVHYLVTNGGMDKSGAWRESSGKFLVPVRALSPVFRARVRDGVRRLLPEVFQAIPAAVWRRDWVVHTQGVGNGEQALRYLARYIYRVALADSAILYHDENSVTFRYRDSETGKGRRMTLAPEEFIRRFLQHVLPAGLVKVRHYGLHHPARRKDLARVRAGLCLRQGIPLPEEPAPAQAQIPLCPHCREPMILRGRFCFSLPPVLAQARAPPVCA